MPKIIIDTDPGQDIDDLLALHFALLRPELEVVAITTVTWPTTDRARLVRRLLRHLGREDIPVGAGMELPLRRVEAKELQSQRNRAATMNHACFAEPHDDRDDVHEDAVMVLARALESSNTPITVCCLAPLTNIACLLRRRPDLGTRIASIYLMGGEVNLDRAEHNIAFDPIAADIVFSSDIPIQMGTWDVTHRFVLDPQDLARFAAPEASPLHRALAQAIAAWHPAQSWKPGPVMYDIFSLIAVFDASCYDLAEMAVQVVTSGPNVGRTIPGTGDRVLVTTGIHEQRVRELYLSTIFPSA